MPFHKSIEIEDQSVLNIDLSIWQLEVPTTAKIYEFFSQIQQKYIF